MKKRTWHPVRHGLLAVLAIGALAATGLALPTVGQATTERDQQDTAASVSAGAKAAEAASEKQPGGPRFEPTGETYAEYSMMFERSAGQFWGDTAVAGQWAWNPQGNGESRIGWGHPDEWPPKSTERFIRDGNWVMLDGWGADELYYELDVEKEQIGDVDCNNLRDLPIDEQGRQRYVRWDIPSEGYCMKTWGTIVQKPGDARIKFGHTQVWTPPHSCSNPHLGQQTCIGQWESWWDDQDNPGKPIEKKLDRQIQIAKGIGMSFTIDQTFPQEWHANLKHHWTW